MSESAVAHHDSTWHSIHFHATSSDRGTDSREQVSTRIECLAHARAGEFVRIILDLPSAGDFLTPDQKAGRVEQKCQTHPFECASSCLLPRPKPGTTLGRTRRSWRARQSSSQRKRCQRREPCDLNARLAIIGRDLIEPGPHDFSGLGGASLLSPRPRNRQHSRRCQNQTSCRMS